jgi:hypothetical protein
MNTVIAGLSFGPRVTSPGGVDLNAKGAPTIADALYKGIEPQLGSPGHNQIVQELQSGSLSDTDLKSILNDPKVPSWMKDLVAPQQ